MTVSSKDTGAVLQGTVLVETPDGRQLGACQWGDPEGAPLFVLHGTPGSRFLRHAGDACAERGLRAITYDRPGYGVSTRRPGHTVADAAADIRSVADHLGVDRFGVMGISGGGPRALAAAALLPGRVTRCATVVSGAPPTAADLDFYAGMDEENRNAWEAARHPGTAFEADCEEVVAWVRDGLPGITFDSPDDETMLRDTFTEAVRQGDVGYRDDRLALVHDWGFALADVAVPTRLMFAEEDHANPRGHWDWLAAHLPTATLVPVPGGHFGPRQEPELRLVEWVGHPTS